MKIRTKLLILLLLISLLPLTLSMINHSISSLRLSNKLTNDTREQLQENANTLLLTLMDEYGQILKRDTAQVLLALHLQAREVERLLANPPANNFPIYFSEEFEHPSSQPEGLNLSTQHFRPGAKGDLHPIPVTYQQQVVFLPAGVKQTTVAEDLGRLSPMPNLYRLVRDIRPDLFLWQYTALDSGIHTSFPGKGGYPAEYDPRQREWYLAAKKAAKPISKVITDLSTRTQILTMSMPVYRPNGDFAGVTAIDVTYQWLFANWQLPAPWKDMSEAMILKFHDDTKKQGASLEIIYRAEQQGYRGNWQMPVKQQFLRADDPQSLKEIFEDLQHGKSGVRKVRYQGQDYLWAYGVRIKDQPFPLISMPYEQVMAQATRAEAFAQDQLLSTLKVSVIMLFGVVVIVFVLAFRRSRKVTQPILELSEAVEGLSEGDLDVRVNIHTGDELETLGSAFNTMGARLLEREQMKQSLLLAREIQQHLLPSKAPQISGFDIFGQSVYCDETGGDYYDFIELSPNKLGVAVGDVSGHGIGAAMLMTTARGILRSQASHQGCELSPLMTTLNRHLVRDTRDDSFMTLFYALLESDTRACHWVSGGHGPTFYYSHRDKIVTELACSGIPLGIIEETEFEAMSPIFMASGDILLIGTDGIWETRNQLGGMFGSHRLTRLMEEYASASAAEISSAVMTAVNEFRDSAPQYDDITMVVIKAVV